MSKRKFFLDSMWTCQLISFSEMLEIEVIPFGKSTWWAGVASDRFPKSIKIGPRTTAIHGWELVA